MGRFNRFWIVLTVAVAFIEQTSAERARSWCYYGSYLCRGSSTARSIYEHTTVLSSEGLVYLFGGRSSTSSDTIYKANYAEEISPSGWSVQQIKPDAGSVLGRAGHAAVMWSPGNGTAYMVVFGGSAYSASKTVSLLNDLQVLDVSKAVWTTYSANATGSSTLPQPRQYPSMELLGLDLLAVYGGQDYDGTYLSDLWFFNLTSKSWWGPAQYQTGSPSLPAAAQVSLLSSSQDMLLLYGGWQKTVTSTGPSTSAVSYTLLKDMYVINLAPAPWKSGAEPGSEPAKLAAYQVTLDMPGGVSPDVHIAAFDAKMAWKGTDLYIAALGGVSTVQDQGNGANDQSAWHQWLSVYQITSASTGLASGIASAPAGTTVTVTMSRVNTWSNVVGSAAGLVNAADGSALDLVTGDIRNWPTSASGVHFVVTSGLMMVPDSNYVLFTGGIQENGTAANKVSSDSMLFDWGTGASLSLDASMKGSDYISLSDSTYTMFKSMMVLGLPQMDGTDASTLIYFGLYDTSAAAQPDFSDVHMYDISTATVLNKCSPSAAAGQCSTINLSGNGTPTPRQDYVAGTTVLTFSGVESGTNHDFIRKSAAIMVYGGYFETGGSAPDKPALNSGGYAILLSAVQACDATLPSTYVQSLASCGWKKMSSSGCTCSTSSNRRLLADASSSSGEDNDEELHMAALPPSLNGGVQTAATAHGSGFSSKKRALFVKEHKPSLPVDYGMRQAVPATTANPGRKLQQTAPQKSTVWTNELVVGLYQDTIGQVLQNVKAGPAWLYTTALNVTGGALHSPGPRVGAASSQTDQNELLVCGGLTYPNSNAQDTDPASFASTSPVELSIDIHIIKLYVGGDTFSQPSLTTCHDNDPSQCTSARPWSRDADEPPATVPLQDPGGSLEYPLSTRGVYAYSYELKPAAGSALPEPRIWHSIQYMNDPLMQSTFGTQGIVLLFGGANSSTEANSTALLNDLWAFCLTNHTWIQLQPAGTAPAPRFAAAMTSYQSQVFISGGSVWHNDTQSWVIESNVYSLDFSLGATPKWRVMEGGEGTELSSSVQAEPYTSMAYSSTVGQILINLPTDLYFVPVTQRVSKATLGTSTDTLQAHSLARALTSVYDGDTIVLNDITEVDMEQGLTLTFSAGVFFQGNTNANSLVSNRATTSTRRLLQHTSHFASIDEQGGGAYELPIASQSGRVYVASKGSWITQTTGPASSSDDSRTPGSGSDEVGVARRRRRLIAQSSLLGVATSSDTFKIPTSAASTQAMVAYASLWSFGFTVIDCQALPGSTALQFSAGTSTISNLLIMNCQDTAVLVTGSAGLSVENCIFFNNTGDLGGAIRVESGATLNITDSVFLSNSAVRGSAVYLAVNAYFHHIQRTAFHANGQTTTAQFGGAVYVDGCPANIDSSLFLWNGLTAETSAGSNASVSQGGAIYINSPNYTPSCASITISNTQFTGNAVASYGGAISFFGVGRTTSTTLSQCTFTDNTAGSRLVPDLVGSLSAGGALYIKNTNGDFTMTDVTFSGNTARRQGGAVMTSLVGSVFANSLSFLNNSATLASGGAWYAEKDGEVILTACTLDSNSAKYGGAFGAAHDTSVYFRGTTFKNNNATSLGGAVEASLSSYVEALSCTFTDNTASSAGAIALVNIVAGTIADCDFNRNQAHTEEDLATSCARGAEGAGGAMCMLLQGEVRMSNNSFVDNKATNGGALHITQTCEPNDDSYCGPLILTFDASKTVSGNAAVGGGGGVIWMYNFTNAHITCPSGDQLSLATNTTTCSSWIPSQDSTYGPLLATAATRVAFANPVSGIWKSYLASSSTPVILNVMLEVLDSLNQTIKDGSAEASAQFVTTLQTSAPLDDSDTSYTGSLSGSSVVSAAQGSAQYYDLTLKAKAGSYAVKIKPSGLLTNLSSDLLQINVRRCRVGETTNDDNDQCNPCKGETYSLSTTDSSCKDCPETAICTYTGKYEEEVPVGSVLVPKTGFWHSHIWSDQIHSCVNPSSCVGDRTVMTKYQQEVAVGNVTLNETYYSQLQCLEGYNGNMCAGCNDGYGRQGKGICAKCPDINRNSLYYFLANLVNVLMVILTIRSQRALNDRYNEVTGGNEGNTSNNKERKVQDSNAAEEEDENGVKIPKGAKSFLGALKFAMNQVKGGAGGGSGRFMGGGSDRNSDGRGSNNIVNLPKVKRKAQKKGDDDEVGSPPQSITIKILINYLQIAGIVQGVDLQWPEAIEGFLMSADHVANGVGQAVSLDCSLSHGSVPKSIITAVITVATPIIIMVLSVPVWLLIWRYHMHKKGDAAPPFKPYMHNRLIITAISIAFYFYANLTVQLLSIFNCPTLDKAGRDYSDNAKALGEWWAEDYNLQCYRGPHLILVLAVGAPGVLLFCIGVPVVSALFLMRNQHRLTDPQFAAAYGFLYGDYEQQWYFWESVVMARKFVVVVVVIFLYNVGVDMQLMVALGVVVLGTIAHMMCQPFKLQRLDGVERLSLWGSTLIVYVALYFVIASSGYGLKTALSFVLVITNCIVVALLVSQVFREWLNAYLESMDMDGDGYLSRKDVADYFEWLQERSSTSNMIAARLALAVVNMLTSYESVRSLAGDFIFFPCEHLGQPPPAPALPGDEQPSDNLSELQGPDGNLKSEKDVGVTEMQKASGEPPAITPSRAASWLIRSSKVAPIEAMQPGTASLPGDVNRDSSQPHERGLSVRPRGTASLDTPPSPRSEF